LFDAQYPKTIADSANKTVQVPVRLRPNLTPGGNRSSLINFPSPERARLTNPSIRNVAPDGYATLSLVRNRLATDYAESIFLDAKAYSGRAIRLTDPYISGGFYQSSGDPEEPTPGSSYQTLGFLDALRNSPARRARIGAIPSMMFLTTSDTYIGPDVLFQANFWGVTIWQSILCEYRSSTPITRTNPARLQMSQLVPLDADLYLETGWTPRFSGLANVGSLLAPGTRL
jgi:hypothetical protein